MYCSICGAELPVGTKFCSMCGEPVPEEPTQKGENEEDTPQQDGSVCCGRCGAELAAGAKICEICGEPVPGESTQHSESRENGGYDGNAENKWYCGDGTGVPPKRSVWPTIVVTLLFLVGAYVFFFQDGLFHYFTAEYDLKNMIFDQYGILSLGDAVKENVSNPQWNTEKLDSNHYTVTLTGFLPQLSSHVTVDFNVTYSGDYVRVATDCVSINGDDYSDTFSAAFILSTIYGN